jgi:hypothetical protein
MMPAVTVRATRAQAYTGRGHWQLGITPAVAPAPVPVPVGPVDPSRHFSASLSRAVTQRRLGNRRFNAGRWRPSFWPPLFAPHVARLPRVHCPRAAEDRE